MRISHLSISGQSYSVVRTTGHFCHSLVQKVGGHQGRGQAMVGGPIAQLAVSIVAPGENLSIYMKAGNSLKWSMELNGNANLAKVYLINFGNNLVTISASISLNS